MTTGPHGRPVTLKGLKYTASHNSRGPVCQRRLVAKRKSSPAGVAAAALRCGTATSRVAKPSSAVGTHKSHSSTDVRALGLLRREERPLVGIVINRLCYPGTPISPIGCCAVLGIQSPCERSWDSHTSSYLLPAALRCWQCTMHISRIDPSSTAKAAASLHSQLRDGLAHGEGNIR